MFFCFNFSLLCEGVEQWMNKKSCSVTKKLKIVCGNLEDYRKLARFHYRDSSLISYAGIFAMRLGRETVGVIVYSMPSIGLELRNIAT